MSRPAPHQVEQDGGEILTSIQKVIEQCLAWADHHKLFIKAAGLATQRSTVVAWNKITGLPLAPALSWQDTRTADWLAALNADPQEIRKRTGLPFSPHYGASKMRWLLEHAPAVRNASSHHQLAMGPLASFLLHNIVATHPMLADHSNASRTLLWNIQTRDWDPRLTDLFGIDPDWLPQTAPIQSHFGTLQGTGIPITIVSGDQSAAVFGHGPTDKNTAIVNVGTGAFILLPGGDLPVPHPSLLSGIINSDSRRARYCLEGTVNGAGAALSQVGKQFGIDDIPSINWAGVEHPAVILNTVGGLGSPWWLADVAAQIDCVEKDAATCIAGVMESIVFMLTANLRELQSAGHQIREIKIGGGLSQADELCQRLANLTGLPVRRSCEAEITALGAARLVAAEECRFQAPATVDFVAVSDKALENRFDESMRLIQGAIK